MVGGVTCGGVGRMGGLGWVLIGFLYHKKLIHYVVFVQL